MCSGSSIQKLKSLDFLTSNERLPHLDPNYFTFINTLYDHRDIPVIEGQIENAMRVKDGSKLDYILENARDICNLPHDQRSYH